MSRYGVTAILLSLAVPAPARAHPGSGIVVDKAGNVYFVVLGTNTIMRLGGDGKVTAFVTDERLRLPHHLIPGRDGVIYVASDHDGVVWRAGPDGSLREYFNSARVSLRDHSAEVSVGSYGDPFTVDSAGNVYALARPGGSTVVRISPDGRLTPVARSARLGALHFASMALGADGVLYLTDANRVWRVVGDSASAIVPRGIALTSAAGLVIDPAGNILVADFGGGRVVRLAPDGSVNTPAALERLRVRNPVGVTIAGSDVYVLDSPPGGVAVWRVSGNATERLYSRMSPVAYLRWAFPGVLVLLVVLVILNGVLKARAKRRAAIQPAS